MEPENPAGFLASLNTDKPPRPGMSKRPPEGQNAKQAPYRPKQKEERMNSNREKIVGRLIDLSAELLLLAADIQAAGILHPAEERPTETKQEETET